MNHVTGSDDARSIANMEAEPPGLPGSWQRDDAPAPDAIGPIYGWWKAVEQLKRERAAMAEALEDWLRWRDEDGNPGGEVELARRFRSLLARIRINRPGGAE